MWVIGTILVTISIFFVMIGLILAFVQLRNGIDYWSHKRWAPYFLFVGVGIALYGASQYF
jgi:hypothetical protein